MAPIITAIVPTRNRGASVTTTVSTLLANDHPDFEVLVVDQSIDDSTETSVEQFLADPRFKYVRTNTVGKGRGVNFGLTQVESPYVAFTDDDCEIPPDWLSCITDIFEAQPRVLMVYTNVVAGPHDASAGFVPDYVRTDDQLVTTVFGKLKARGIGASMAAHRERLMSVGGMDQNMGPGGRFPSAGDRDIAIRSILAGWEVYETSKTAVIHHGFRTWEEGKVLTERDWVAMGAMCAKPLRAGHWKTIVYPVYELVAFTLIQPLMRLREGRRPQGFKRGLHFVRGFIEGWKAPLDREQLLYLDVAPDEGRVVDPKAVESGS